MITLAVNELIKDVETEIIYRILWIDEGNMVAYVFDTESEKALPFLLSIKEISQELIENSILLVSLVYDLNMHKMLLSYSYNTDLHFCN